MKGFSKFFLSFTFVGLMFLGFSGSAAAVTADKDTCTVIDLTTPPFVISSEGSYCLMQNWQTNLASGDAITINTNNVVLDLNGHKIGNLAAGSGTLAIGIDAVNRKNITIKNGTVRGFLEGIFLGDSGSSQGHVIEGIRGDLNTAIGINVSGTGNIIRNNLVVATGGSTATSSQAVGIEVSGRGNSVINNDVVDVLSSVGKPGVGIATLCCGAVGGTGSAWWKAIESQIRIQLCLALGPQQLG